MVIHKLSCKEKLRKTDKNKMIWDNIIYSGCGFNKLLPYNVPENVQKNCIYLL